MIRFAIAIGLTLIAGQVASKAIANLAQFNHANAVFPHN